MADPRRSEHVERFNHDGQARRYDANVEDERNPVRAGYAAALSWVADRCNAAGAGELLELGCGTGNLTSRLRAGVITAVDISTEMMALAAAKIGAGQEVRFVRSDALEFVHSLSPGSLDVVASTYALHHLTDAEKPIVLARLAQALRPGGRLVVADLMFADAGARARIISDFVHSGRRGVAASIEEEFYWDVATTNGWLAELGFVVEWAPISTLTWCVQAGR
jgi:putative AdoMet-dependent methyltransferase